ncbi:hypothetical protein EJ08DRAFT_666641 [Tothia fuscella]|uniref:Uncharacterized protein n=1 Tax=Tothia fuscella TaxID=1048955 RepID=A0A9P4NE24_9PEZI|nr:hypothetical protein EJ08DRAFT_666641 [Tothia fuscella]
MSFRSEDDMDVEFGLIGEDESRMSSCEDEDEDEYQDEDGDSMVADEHGMIEDGMEGEKRIEVEADLDVYKEEDECASEQAEEAANLDDQADATDRHVPTVNDALTATEDMLGMKTETTTYLSKPVLWPKQFPQVPISAPTIMRRWTFDQVADYLCSAVVDSVTVMTRSASENSFHIKHLSGGVWGVKMELSRKLKTIRQRALKDGFIDGYGRDQSNDDAMDGGIGSDNNDDDDDDDDHGDEVLARDKKLARLKDGLAAIL